MGRRRLGSLAWLGMILAGCCLGAAVVLAWPEPTTYMTRLPHGESTPKTPSIVANPQAPVTRVVSSADAVAPPQAEIVPEDEATVERALAGPPPVSSEAETDDGYRPETPEELGAKPLPGMYPDAATP